MGHSITIGGTLMGALKTRTSTDGDSQANLLMETWISTEGDIEVN
jgi:hypothetical protein